MTAPDVPVVDTDPYDVPVRCGAYWLVWAAPAGFLIGALLGMVLL